MSYPRRRSGRLRELLQLPRTPSLAHIYSPPLSTTPPPSRRTAMTTSKKSKTPSQTNEEKPRKPSGAKKGSPRKAKSAKEPLVISPELREKVSSDFSDFIMEAWLMCTEDRRNLKNPQEHFSALVMLAETAWNLSIFGESKNAVKDLLSLTDLSDEHSRKCVEILAEMKRERFPEDRATIHNAKGLFTPEGPALDFMLDFRNEIIEAEMGREDSDMDEFLQGLCDPDELIDFLEGLPDDEDLFEDEEEDLDAGDILPPEILKAWSKNNRKMASKKAAPKRKDAPRAPRKKQ